jgi:6-phosphogluconolactonase
VIYQLDLPLDVVAHSHSDAARSAAQLAETVASALREAIDSHGRASLVVSGGRSPLAFFQCLSRQDLDWSKVVVSLADERWVDPRSTQSNEYLVTHYLLQGRAASAAFIGLYQPAGSPDVAALAADAALEELPQPIDVLVLGMGEDGHTASLFAGSPNLAQALDPEGERRCLPMQAPTEPRERLTLTLPLLLAARHQLLVIGGSAKVGTLRRAIAGNDMREMPIRAFLRYPLEIHWHPE